MSRLALIAVLSLLLLPGCASSARAPGWHAGEGLLLESSGGTLVRIVEDGDWEAEPAPIWARLLLWVPDRILDVLDTFSFDAHVGLGVGVDVHATRAIQAVAVARGGTAGLGWHWGRSLGVMTRTEAGLSVGPFGVHAGSMALAGTSGADSGTLTMGGIHDLGDEVYAEDARDYWAAGASVTAGVVGVDFDLHLGEILDLVLGVLLIDIYGDDLGS